MPDAPHVLIVDDEPHLLEALSRLLSLSSYRVQEAPTAGDALRLARAAPPDLVLLDVVLPDMSGTEVCRQIKADPALVDTHVILFSGIMTDSDAQAKGMAAGADGYMSRPLSNRELLSRLEAALRTQRAEKALREANELYQATTERVSEAILIADDAGTLVHVAGNVRAIFGYSVQEAFALGHLSSLIGRQICRPDHVPALGGRQSIQQQIEDRKGREHTLSIDVKRLSAQGNGKVLYICHDESNAGEATKGVPQESPAHLERLVNDCMAKLALTKEQLESEIAERLRLERALHAATQKARPASG